MLHWIAISARKRFAGGGALGQDRNGAWLVDSQTHGVHCAALGAALDQHTGDACEKGAGDEAAIGGDLGQADRSAQRVGRQRKFEHQPLLARGEGDERGPVHLDQLGPSCRRDRRAQNMVQGRCHGSAEVRKIEL